MNFSEDIREAVKKLIRDNVHPDEVDDKGARTSHLDKNYVEIPDAEPKRGAYGKVLKMMRMEDLQVVAVKEIELNLKTDYADTRAVINRRTQSVKHDTEAVFDFLMACQEAVLQSSEEMHHPNIVRCYESWVRPPYDDPEWETHMDPESLIDFIEDDKQITSQMKRCLTTAKGLRFYIVMSLYDKSLEDRCYDRSDDPPSRHEISSILTGICRALAFIHSKGYVHRDLKPGNILINGNPNNPDEPEVALGDFGLCGRVTDGKSLERAGTPPYNSAPEPSVTDKFDMWSLGFLMFEMFFVSKFTYGVNESKKTAAFMRLEELAKTNRVEDFKQFVGTNVKQRKIKNMVIKCLETDPKQRIASDEILEELSS